MRKVLMLAHRIPFPPNKGDKIRTFNVLRQITAHYECHLAFLIDSDSDLQYLPLIEAQVDRMAWARIPSGAAGRILRAARAIAQGHSLSQALLYDPSLQATIALWLSTNDYHAVMCTAAPMSAYLEDLIAEEGQSQRPRLLMDFIDVDSLKWAQYAQRSGGFMKWVYQREARHVARLEQRVLESFDQCFLVTDQEVGLLDPDCRHQHLGACGNGVDLEFFNPGAAIAPAASGTRQQTIHPSSRFGPWVVFTGVMDYLPNIEGIRWFVDEVWPRVRTACPTAELAIVGARPTAEVMQLAAHPGVHVTGFVDDVRLWLHAATVCVAPLQIARGIQNKVLEAMAMAKPVVCTPQAFEGIQAESETELKVAQTPQSFAEAVIELLASPQTALAIGAAARQRVEKHYRWDEQMRPLREALS